MVRLKAKKTQAPINSAGERLKRAREDRGLSFEQVHKATKIHPNVLKALEEDRLAKVLGKTYVKPFLRDYAHYLGLDTEEIIREYDSRRVPEGEAGKEAIWGKSPVPQKNKRFNHAVIIASVFIAWIFILSFVTIRFIDRYKEVVALRKSGVPERPRIDKDLIPIPKSRTIALTIVPNKDVWLKVTQDGELAFHGILPKDSKETWQAAKEIRLSEIGRPDAFKLNVNGRDIDFSERRPGKNILITHEGINLEPKS